MPDIDPRRVHYQGNKEFGQSDEGRTYNRKGGESWQSVYDHNVAETKEQEKEARRKFEEEEDRKSRQQPQRMSSSPSYDVPSAGGASFGLGGLLGGVAALFTGYLGCAAVVGALMLVCAVIGFLEYHSRGLRKFFRNALGAVGDFFSMPFTAWPYLFLMLKDSFWCKMELIFSIGIIVYTIIRYRNDRFFVDVPYIPALVGLVVLEFIRHFNGEFGVIGSLYNGVCLAIPVLIILSVIEKIADNLD